MRVIDLIGKLSEFDPDTEVGIVFDGAHRMDVDFVWLSRKGIVLLTESNEVIYETEDRPENSPTTEENRYWSLG